MSLNSLWDAILQRIAKGLDDISQLLQPRDPTDRVGFSIAFIALAAKLAKADGHVTRDEVTMFRRIFLIPPEEEENAARVYNLCRQEMTGYESYARSMQRIMGSGPRAEGVLTDVIDGLFHIAMADNEFHPSEERFLRTVHRIFNLPDTVFRRLMARHVPEAWDPYEILGVSVDADPATLRNAWRARVKENHPDVLIARGLPPDMIELANNRLADINRAYDAVT